MDRDEYAGVAKATHWLIALLIFIQFPLAWVMDDFTGLQKFKLYNWHKSIGITLLALMALRLLWRLVRPAPSLPLAMPKQERVAAHLTHLALYITLLLMPLTGWAMISSSNLPSVLYLSMPFPLIPWLSRLPDAEKKVYFDFFQAAHGVLGYVLLGLIAFHVAAALRHALILKDRVLLRMLPRFLQNGGYLRIAAIALFAGFAALGATPQARAMEWSVNPAKSQIAFEATGSGYVTKGAFKQFRSEIEFDPDTPEQTSVRVSLDVGSVTTGTADIDSALQGSDYFDPAKFPTALFVARGAKPDGEGKYILNGRLTLKGVTRPVAMPFSIDIQSGTATVKGETTINRLDFGVGPASVAGLTIDKDVKVIINLVAVRLDN
ncbi:MAG TPA: YceI family protein [Hyphomicrobiales bacterium]|nr:YceI family protein [Hyphomicrobiales bacterium]